MSKYFGTDGFRGKAGKTLLAEHAYVVGRFLGWYYQKNKPKNERAKIVIGKDTRLSGYMLESALVSGIVTSGADAYLMHVTTTPSVAYIARIDKFDAGVMISASHNAFYDNGLKLINSRGEKMEDSVIDELEEYLEDSQKASDLPRPTEEELGRSIDYASGRNRYIGYLISCGLFSLKGLKIGLDCANGSAWNIAKSVFDALGATTYVINNSPNGTNINRNAGSTHIEGLCEFVKKEKLDVGFAYDGDADRCLAVDEKGKVVDGDQIMYLCAKHLKQKGELTSNTVVATIMSNLGLFVGLKELDINVEKTKVGDKYVYDAMNKGKHEIGGEQSGHIIFKKYATSGDGILTSIKVVEVMLDTKRTLNSLASEMERYPQVLENVIVNDKERTLQNAKLKTEIEKITKELGETGRVLVRASGTEPVIRVMSEAKTQKKCQDAVRRLVKIIKENN